MTTRIFTGLLICGVLSTCKGESEPTTRAARNGTLYHVGDRVITQTHRPHDGPAIVHEVHESESFRDVLLVEWDRPNAARRTWVFWECPYRAGASPDEEFERCNEESAACGR